MAIISHIISYLKWEVFLFSAYPHLCFTFILMAFHSTHLIHKHVMPATLHSLPAGLSSKYTALYLTTNARRHTHTKKRGGGGELRGKQWFKSHLVCSMFTFNALNNMVATLSYGILISNSRALPDNSNFSALLNCSTFLYLFI